MCRSETLIPVCPCAETLFRPLPPPPTTPTTHKPHATPHNPHNHLPPHTRHDELQQLLPVRRALPAHTTRASHLLGEPSQHNSGAELSRPMPLLDISQCLSFPTASPRPFPLPILDLSHCLSSTFHTAFHPPLPLPLIRLPLPFIVPPPIRNPNPCLLPPTPGPCPLPLISPIPFRCWSATGWSTPP